MVVATVTTSEQVLFKSDKGTASLAVDPHTGEKPCPYQDTFMNALSTYWSSSEYAQNTNNSWNVNFNNGNQNNNNKNNPNSARPVRGFKQKRTTGVASIRHSF